MCVNTYTLDGVGTGWPEQHWDSLVLFIGVDIQSHFVGGQAKGCDHLIDAAGEKVSEGDRENQDFFFWLKFSKLTAPIAMIGITAADQNVLWSEVHTKSRNCELCPLSDPWNKFTTLTSTTYLLETAISTFQWGGDDGYQPLEDVLWKAWSATICWLDILSHASKLGWLTLYKTK